MSTPPPERSYGVFGCRALIAVALLAWLVMGAAVVQRVGQPFPGFLFKPTLERAGLMTFGWSGKAGELQVNDALVSANGRTLRTAGDLERLVTELPAGSPVRYEFVRRGQRMVTVIPTQILDLASCARTLLAIWLTGGCFLAIGIFAFWHKPTDPAARALLMFSLAVGWVFTALLDFYTTHRLGPGLVLAFFWAGGAIWHLTLTFPRPMGWLRQQPGRAFLAYLPCALATVPTLLWYHPLTMAVDPGSIAVGSRFITAWTVLMALGILGSLTTLCVASFRSRGHERRQAQVVLAGMTLAFLPVLALYILPRLLGPTLLPISPPTLLLVVATASFPLSIAYAVLRHHLFEIERVIKHTLTYAIVVTLLGALYVLVIAGLYRGVGVLWGPSTPRLGNFLATALVAMGFAPLREWTKQRVDALFYRTPYDFQQVIADFGDEARTILETPRLRRAFLERVERALAPGYVALLEVGDEGRDLIEQDALGCAAGERASLPLEALLPLMLDDRGLRMPVAFGPYREALAFPLVIKDEVLGCVLVGPRKSDRAYGARDIVLLETLGRQLAVWLQNTRLFARLLAHSQQLERLTRELQDRNHEVETQFAERTFELRTALAQLEELDRLKTGFVNAVSHELRTPLTSIMGYAEFLEDGIGGPLGAEQQLFVAQILASSKRLQELVDDLLDVAKLEAGTFRLVPCRADLSAKICEVVESLRPQANDARLLLQLELGFEPLEVEMDPRRIGQVLINLLSNAIKFTPAGGSVTVVAARMDQSVRVSVSDTGPGIPAEAVGRLFQPFYQVDSSTTRKAGGTGLGLSICKAIVEAHGGTIGVASQPDGGSTFHFELPMRQHALVEANELA